VNFVANEIELDEADLQPIEADEAPAPKQSLDDVISKALDDAEAPADEAPTDGRSRDEKGRFAPNTESEAAAAPDEGTSDQPPPVESTEQKPQNAQPDPISEGHFRGWSPEQRAAFQALPPQAQKVALDVVKGRDQFYSERINAYDEALRNVSPLVTAVKPHVARIQQATDDVSGYVARVLDIDHKLQFAPYAEKTILLGQLAERIGVPISIAQPDAFADPISMGGEAYPVIHDLRNQLTQLQAQVQSYQRSHESVQQQQITSDIRDFALQTNADGTPAHPYFDTVRGTMGQLLDAGKASTMAEAYAMAVKPIEDAIAKRIADQSKAAEAASQAALAKARKAMPVKKTGMVPGGKTKGGGLDAIIGSALNQAGFN
jgi:hypothetical protein